MAFVSCVSTSNLNIKLICHVQLCIAGEEPPNLGVISSPNTGPSKVPVRPGNQQDIILDEVPAYSDREFIEKNGDEKKNLAKLSSYGASSEKAGQSD